MAVQQEKDQEEGSELFRSQFKRTRLCSFFLEGRCRYGSKCAFAHGTEMVEPPPDLTKTSLCQQWLEGNCTRASADCRFAHGKHELRVTPHFSRLIRPPPGEYKDESAAPPSTAVHHQDKRSSTQPGGQGITVFLEAQLDLNGPPGVFAPPPTFVSAGDRRSVASDFPLAPGGNVKDATGQSPIRQETLFDETVKVSSGIRSGDFDAQPSASLFRECEAKCNSDDSVYYSSLFLKAGDWEHWEVETATGETNSDDGSARSLSEANTSPTKTGLDQNATGGYSAFSGLQGWEKFYFAM